MFRCTLGLGLVALACGCQGSGFDSLYGQHTIPPPGTGAAGQSAPAGNNYYTPRPPQPGVGAGAGSAPRLMTPPAFPGETPAPNWRPANTSGVVPAHHEQPAGETRSSGFIPSEPPVRIVEHAGPLKPVPTLFPQRTPAPAPLLGPGGGLREITDLNLREIPSSAPSNQGSQTDAPWRLRDAPAPSRRPPAVEEPQVAATR